MILIPLRQQPSYEELRYCLRAIEQYHSEERVLIIGAKPHWLCNCLHIPFTDHPHHEHKARSIYRKILEGFKYADRLLFFNDDHIILAPVDYVHHKGPIDLNSRDNKGTYTALLRNTLRIFDNVCGPPILDYDTHCPIWYEREAFSKLSVLDWDKPHGYGIKTSYCTLNKIEGTYYPDLKFRKTIGDISGRLYFSTDDDCNLEPLKVMFPTPSKFERI